MLSHGGRGEFGGRPQREARNGAGLNCKQPLGQALIPDVFVVGHEWPTYSGQVLWWVKTHPTNCEGVSSAAAVMDTARAASTPSPALPHGGTLVSGIIFG